MSKLSVSMTDQEKGLGWMFFVVQLLFLPLLLVIINGLLGLQLNDGQLNFLLFSINFGLTLGIFHRYLRRCGQVSLADPWRCLRAAFVGFLIYYAGTFLEGLLFDWLAPGFANVNDTTVAAMTRENYTIMAIGTVLLVPVTEETLYRGLVFGSLRCKSRVLAYGVSVLVFSAIHVLGYIGTESPLTLALCFLQYFPAGIALAWAYEKADSIWAPILIHMTVNQMAVSSLLLP